MPALQPSTQAWWKMVSRLPSRRSLSTAPLCAFQEPSTARPALLKGKGLRVFATEPTLHPAPGSLRVAWLNRNQAWHHELTLGRAEGRG